MNLGQRLLKLMAYRDVTQEKLAELVDCSQSTITKLINNHSKRSKFMTEICRVLDCSPDWLEKGFGDDPTNRSGIFKPIYPHASVPLIEWNEISLEKSLFGNKDRKMIPKYADGGKNCFSLRVRDDSMVSSIPNSHSFLVNDLIIIDPDAFPKHGDFVIAIEKISKQPLFKQYIMQGNQIYLSSLNPSYPPLLIDENIEIKGVVIEQTRSIKK